MEFRNPCSNRSGDSPADWRIFHAMSIIPLTIFFSLLLAGFFMVLFAHSQRRRSFSSSESESLLPLADEQPRLVRLDRHPEPDVERNFPARSEGVHHPQSSHEHAHGDHNDATPRPSLHDHAPHDHRNADDSHAAHDHDDSTCGCRSGKRLPCPGCLKRVVQPAPPSL